MEFMALKLETCRMINFKSFRDAGDIKLNKFNVLISPNGSGKTNFVDFFKFLKRLFTFHILNGGVVKL